MLKKAKLAVAIAAICMGSQWELCAQSADFDQSLALFQQRQWAAAARAFQRVEEQKPGTTDALLYRAKCLVNLGEIAAAQVSLLAYIPTHPQSEDAAYLLAYVLFRENKARESLQQFTDAGKIKPPTANDLKIVALDYVLLNDYADASHFLEISLKLDPNDVEARYHLGRIRYQQNRFDEAISAFNEVLKHDPANLKAQNNLGLSLEGKNQIAQAMDAYRKAIEIDSRLIVQSEEPYLNLGVLLIKSNQAEEAASVLSSARKIRPNSSKVHYQLGKAFFDLNRLPEALQEEKDAVSLDSDDSASHYLLGRIYQRLGKTELAAQQFKLTETLRRAKESRSGPGMTSESEPK